MSIKIVFDSNAFQEALKKAPSRLLVGMKIALNQIGGEFVGKLQAERLSGGAGLYRRTGKLSGSFRKRVVASEAGINIPASGKGAGGKFPAQLNLFVFTDVKYARIHEDGGIITPKTSRHLWIPIGGNKTPAGVARWSPRELFDKLTILGKSKKGNWVMGTKAGQTVSSYSSKTGKTKVKKLMQGIPMFVLVDAIKITPRLGMIKLWERNANHAVSILNNQMRAVCNQWQMN